MKYGDLYDACQAAPSVGRKLFRDLIGQGCGVRIKVAKTDMDVSVCRGMFLSPQNTKHRIVQQLGCAVVVMARNGNNRCWERLVETKEYMHVFDGVDEATDSGDEFNLLLKEFTVGASLQRSPQMMGEIKAFWRALGVLCPETHRQQLIKDKEAGLSDYQAALRLKIPELYIPSLFEPWFLETMQQIRD